MLFRNDESMSIRYCAAHTMLMPSWRPFMKTERMEVDLSTPF